MLPEPVRHTVSGMKCAYWTWTVLCGLSVVFMFFATPAWDNSGMFSGEFELVVWTLLVVPSWPVGLAVLWGCHALFAKLRSLKRRCVSPADSTTHVES
jgi:hypothetical protein